MIKELLINGKLFAKYRIKGDTVYLKPLQVIFPDNEILSEDALVKIILLVESVKCKYVSYLNV